MDIIDKITLRVMELFAEEDATQIAHTQCVAHYTQILAKMEKCSQEQTETLVAAAWLHDVGCPSARAKYGNSLPINQQTEGERIVNEWAEDYQEWSSERWTLISKIVGFHHQYQKMKELHAEVLYEADLIVNLFEGYYPLDNAHHYYNTIVTTDSGKLLFEMLFFKEKRNNSQS